MEPEFISDSDGRRFLPGCVYQSVPGREADLAAELGGVGEVPADWVSGGLVYRAYPPAHPVFWWRNRWDTPFEFSFSSIKEAAAALRSMQRNWVYAGLAYKRTLAQRTENTLVQRTENTLVQRTGCTLAQRTENTLVQRTECMRGLAYGVRVPQGYYGRARLIQDALPVIVQKRRPLAFTLPAAPMGSWTLTGEHTMLASASCASPFPGGIIEFEEDKEGPPSRAYLKLAEAFIRLGTRPAAGETCLDAGASPGGWTWMAGLASRGTGAAPPRIIAVDRAPLAPSVASLPHVTFLRHDAFTLRPEDIGAVDWLFCDAACYPLRLYQWIEKWLASGLCKNYVCTLKMQGRGDMDTARLFAAIPGGTVVHLYHNKHELTWMLRSMV